MSRPWMPLYIADYLADTMHFSAAEHGAYLLLIMHYWQNGSLPVDDARLARIVRMSDAEWASARVVIRPKFGLDWRHERIEGELAEAERLAQAGKKGGAASAEARRNKRNARPKPEADGEPDDEASTAPTPSPTVTQADGQRSAKQSTNDLPTIRQAPQPPPQESGGGGDARAREPLIRPEAITLATEVGVIVGFATPHDWPEGWCGAPARVEVWLANGWKSEIVLPAVRAAMAKKRDGPPYCINFFERAIARAHAQQVSPLPVASASEANSSNGVRHATGGSVIEASDRLLKRIREFGEGASGVCDETGAADVRLLSQG